MKPTKYIFLSGSAKGKNRDYFEHNIDLFFVASWAGLIARRLKSYRPKMDVSVWRIESVVSKPLFKNIFNLDGILWPYKGVIIKNILSIKMLLEIYKLCPKYNVIIHFHSIFDRFILVRFFLPRNVKIVLSHHGGVPPMKR